MGKVQDFTNFIRYNCWDAIGISKIIVKQTKVVLYYWKSVDLKTFWSRLGTQLNEKFENLDLGLSFFEIEIFQNRCKLGNPYYLVRFVNSTKPETVLIETILRRETLYMQSGLLVGVVQVGDFDDNSYYLSSYKWGTLIQNRISWVLWALFWNAY